MKKLYIYCITTALLFMLLSKTGWGQTTVFIDDFNRSALSPGGTPLMTYTTNLAINATASINSSSFLEITNGMANGISYVVGSTSTFSNYYNTILFSNSEIITWTFNFRYNRTTNPAGINVGSYGVAIILAGSSPIFTEGAGYAIVYGNSNTPDPIRLVKYSNGITNSYITNLISSSNNDLTNVNNYVSIRVTYNPNGNYWSLFIRDDGSSGWSDPSIGVTNQIGPIISDNAYTGISLTKFGFIWSHAQTVNSAQFDNFKVTVGTPNPTLSVNPTSLSNFSYIQGSGPSSFQQYTITGSNLNGSEVIISGSTNYEVSKDNTNFSSSISFMGYQNGSINSSIYVRLKSGLSANFYNNETITNSGGGATSVSVTVSGKVLSPEPTQQPTNLSFSNVGTNSMTINWTKAAGTNTIVLMKSGNAVNSNPVDETTYTGNAVFGNGSQIGTGNYVVYAGDLGTINVTGLNQTTNYYVALYSYNGSAELENYLITSPLTGNQFTSTPSLGWQISSVNTAFSIDFDNTVASVNNGQFTGTGFTSSPFAGQLNSNAFRVDGFSEGSVSWGGSQVTTGDFARGISTGGVSTGGIYAFTVSSNNNALGVQPTGDDFTPGNIYLRIQNKTGATINSASVLFKVYIRNDEDRNNTFNFYYSTDDISYTQISNINIESYSNIYKNTIWKSYVRTTTITGLSIANNNYLFLKWMGDDFGGSDSRDEFALDDISIVLNPSNTIPSFSGSVEEAIIDGNTGLSGNTTVDSTLTIRNALLYVNNNILTVNTRINLIDPNDNRMIILDDGTNSGTLKLRVKENNIYYYFHIGDTRNTKEYTPAFIEFNNGTFNDAFLTMKMKNEKHPVNGSTNHYLNRYWTIEPSGITNYSYDLELFYKQDDVTGDDQYMFLGKYDGISWLTLGQADITNKKLARNNLTSFSDFTGGTETGMPVKLSSFSSGVNGRNVNLKWTTEKEENNSGFDIERAVIKGEQLKWDKIGFIQGKGNSNEPSNYNYEDRNLTSGNYKYRLKQIDYNGNFEYYELGTDVIIGVPEKFELGQNYPNPFNPETSINFSLPEKGFALLKVYDVLGREVAVILNEVMEAGYHTVPFNASGLPSGIYFYRLNSGIYNDIKKMIVIR